jgi:hypothetical protein
MSEENYKISSRNGFSDRSGFSPLNKTIQYEKLDEHSRNAISNEFVGILESFVKHFDHSIDSDLARAIMAYLYGEQIKFGTEYRLDSVVELVLNDIINASYQDVFTIIEFFAKILKIDPNYPSYKGLDPAPKFNEVFEDEFIGYRLVQGNVEK